MTNTEKLVKAFPQVVAVKGYLHVDTYNQGRLEESNTVGPLEVVRLKKHCKDLLIPMLVDDKPLDFTMRDLQEMGWVFFKVTGGMVMQTIYDQYQKKTHTLRRDLSAEDLENLPGTLIL